MATKSQAPAGRALEDRLEKLRDVDADPAARVDDKRHASQPEANLPRRRVAEDGCFRRQEHDGEHLKQDHDMKDKGPRGAPSSPW